MTQPRVTYETSICRYPTSNYKSKPNPSKTWRNLPEVETSHKARVLINSQIRNFDFRVQNKSSRVQRVLFQVTVVRGGPSVRPGWEIPPLWLFMAFLPCFLGSFSCLRTEVRDSDLYKLKCLDSTLCNFKCRMKSWFFNSLGAKHLPASVSSSLDGVIKQNASTYKVNGTTQIHTNSCLLAPDDANETNLRFHVNRVSWKCST